MLKKMEEERRVKQLAKEQKQIQDLNDCKTT
jgi:3-phosphoglycerate kinase